MSHSIPYKTPHLPALRVAFRYLRAKSYFQRGQNVTFGKYHNHKGIITDFGTDDKGNPTVTIQPAPKGPRAKKPRVLQLFHIFKDPPPAQPLPKVANRPIPVNKIQARALAHEAYEGVKECLSEHFYQGHLDSSVPESLSLRLRNRITVTDVKGNLVEVPVLVVAKPLVSNETRDWVAGGKVRSYVGDNLKFLKKQRLNLYVNSNKTVHEILSHPTEVIQEFYSVLIHEMTHLQDLLPIRDSELVPADQAGQHHPNMELKDYYNRPTEFHAFLQQVYDEVDSYIQKVNQETEGWGLSEGMPFVEHALRESKTWNRIQQDLNPANRKTLLRAVGILVDKKLGEIFEKNKPDPASLKESVISRYLGSCR